METICSPKKDRKEKKQTGLQVPKNHHHRRKPPPPQAPPKDGLKLAALAIRLNVRLRLADMPISMQERALLISLSLFNTSTSSTDDPSSTSDHHHHRPSPTLIARSLKKEFDSLYGPAWHCVVGKSFGSFVTHSPGGFVYFSMDSLSFLLFKTEVHLVGA